MFTKIGYTHILQLIFKVVKVFLKRDEEEKEDYNAVKKRREIKQKKEKKYKKEMRKLAKRRIGQERNAPTWKEGKI